MCVNYKILTVTIMDITHLNREKLEYVISVVDTEYAFYFSTQETDKDSLRDYFFHRTEDGGEVFSLDQQAYEQLPLRIRTRVQDLIFKVESR